MFITKLFAKPRYGYYSDIKKNEILLFATTWMDLEGVMLSDISQTKKDEYYIIYYIIYM